MSIRTVPTDTPPMMELSAVHRIYRTGMRTKVTALDGVDLRVSDGEMVAVLGGPKSGTSTVEMIRHLKITRDTAVKNKLNLAGSPGGVEQRGKLTPYAG